MGSDRFLNQQGIFTTANVSDTRIDNRVNNIVEDWARRIDDGSGNFVTNSAALVPEAKLPPGTVTARVPFNVADGANTIRCQEVC